MLRLCKPLALGLAFDIDLGIVNSWVAKFYNKRRVCFDWYDPCSHWAGYLFLYISQGSSSEVALSVPKKAARGLGKES